MSILPKFSENVLSKNDLKKLFIATYNSTRVGTEIGIPLNNVTNTICYFISGFNIIWGSISTCFAGSSSSDSSNLITLKFPIKRFK